MRATTGAPLLHSRLPLLLALGAGLGLAAAAWSQRGPSRVELGLAALGLALWIGYALLRRGPGSVLRVPALLPFVVALVPALVASGRLPTTVSNDEQAYLFQASLFAEGRLSEPLLAPACALAPGSATVRTGLCPLHRRQVLELAERGTRSAKYPPGTALAWASGALVGIERLGPALAALALVALAAALARSARVEDPWLVALLVALSPFFLLVATSYQSELASAPFAALALWASWRARETGTVRWALVAGAAAGAVLLTRPLTGVVLALALVLGLAGGRMRASGPRALALAVLGGLPFALALVLHDRLQTGVWFAPPYDFYARRFGPFLDGEPLDVYGKGDLFAGFGEAFARWSTGLFGILGAWIVGFVGLWRLRVRDGGACFAFALWLPLAYALHWYPGHWAYPGPLYAFESLVPLAVGALYLIGAAGPGWRSGLAIAICIAAPGIAVLRFAEIERQVALRFEPERVARSVPDDAVILLPPEPGLKLWLPSRTPLDPGPIRLYDQLDPAANRAALEAFDLSDRPLLRFVPGARPGDGRLEPVE